MNRQVVAWFTGLGVGAGFLAGGLEWYGALGVGLGLFYVIKDWDRGMWQRGGK